MLCYGIVVHVMRNMMMCMAVVQGNEDDLQTPTYHLKETGEAYKVQNRDNEDNGPVEVRSKNNSLWKNIRTSISQQLSRD